MRQTATATTAKMPPMLIVFPRPEAMAPATVGLTTSPRRAGGPSPGIRENIRHEMHKGKPQKQAIAIAMRTAGVPKPGDSSDQTPPANVTSGAARAAAAPPANVTAGPKGDEKVADYKLAGPSGLSLDDIQRAADKLWNKK